MIKIELLPLKGIIIHNIFSKKHIEIGESEKNIIEKLGNPKKIITHDDHTITFYYYKNSLQIHFSGNSLQSFEIAYDLCNNVLLDNENIFKIACDSLITNLTTKYGGFKEEFRKTDYSNLEYSIGFWRPSAPDDFEEDLGENDYQKGMKFTSVLIGKKGYFNE